MLRYFLIIILCCISGNTLLAQHTSEHSNEHRVVAKNPTITDGVKAAYPLIEWNAVPKAEEYEIYLSHRPNLSPPVVFKKVSRNSYQVTRKDLPGNDADITALNFQFSKYSVGLPAGNYVFWVRAYIDGKAQEWSTAHHFSTFRRSHINIPTVLYAPGVELPKLSHINFSWGWSSSAEKYELWVNPIGDTQNAVIHEVISTYNKVRPNYTVKIDPSINALLRTGMQIWIRPLSYEARTHDTWPSEETGRWSSLIVEANDCDDNIDNDADGYIDYNDPDCPDLQEKYLPTSFFYTELKGEAQTKHLSNCDDGIDNDLDGSIDNRDITCHSIHGDYNASYTEGRGGKRGKWRTTQCRRDAGRGEDHLNNREDPDCWKQVGYGLLYDRGDDDEFSGKRFLEDVIYE